MTNNINSVVDRVSATVNNGSPVAARPTERVAARGLVIEFDAEPYPEVGAAFAEYCRVTGTTAELDWYQVRPVEGESPKVRVSVTVAVEGDRQRAHAVADDVVSASVHAFADATARAA